LSEEATAVLRPNSTALLDICCPFRGDRPATFEFPICDFAALQSSVTTLDS
jgi:hypothetical protein